MVREWICNIRPKTWSYLKCWWKKGKASGVLHEHRQKVSMTPIWWCTCHVDILKSWDERRCNYNNIELIHFHAIHGGSLTASPHMQITSCDLCTEKLAVQVNSCSSKQTGNVHPYWTRQYIAPLAGRIQRRGDFIHYISSRVFRRSTLIT